MKKARRFAAIAAAAIMTAAMAVPMSMSSFAADVSLTLSNPVEGAEITGVKAVQIFEGETVDGKFSVTGWGSAVTNDAKAALAAAAGVTGETDASKVAIALDKAVKEADDVDAVAEPFAKVAAVQLGDAAGITGKYDKDEDKYTFANPSDGYYVVVCEVSKGGAWTASSLGMLTIIDNAATEIGKGAAKVGLPQAVKKVQENNEANTATLTANAPGEDDKTYNDVADWNIGEAVPFRLYGTLPDDYDRYETYFYQFNDSLDAQFDLPATVTVTVGGTKYDFTAQGQGVYSCAAVTGSKIVVAADSDNKLTVKIADLKEYIAKKSTDSVDVVKVDYSAVLNATAKAGMDGQENKVTLTYSNNPNQSGDGEYSPTGETPEDKVIVFTYDMKFQKSFWNGQSDLTQEEIENKTYTDLRFTVKDANENTIKVKKYVPADGAEDADKYDYVVSSDADAIDEIPLVCIGEGENRQLVIRIKGLDDGEYTIQESEVGDKKAGAAGYDNNKSITAKLDADTKNTNDDYDKTSDNKKPITSETEDYSVAVLDGDGNKTELGDIQNKKGISLPSTGGIGTTLFYVVGGVLVAGAGVTLITKKRMGDSNK